MSGRTNIRKKKIAEIFEKFFKKIYMCKIRDDEVNSTVYIQNPQWEPHYIAGYFRFTGEGIIRESTLRLEGKCRRGLPEKETGFLSD